MFYNKVGLVGININVHPIPNKRGIPPNSRDTQPNNRSTPPNNDALPNKGHPIE